MSAQQQAGVVTPEAVRLEFQAANVGSRSAAFLLDFAIQGTVFFALAFAVGLLDDRVGLPSWVGVTIFSVLAFLLLFGYPIAFETLTRGRSPGKAALGLRVVTVEGAPERFRHAAIRAVLGLVDFFLLFGGAAVVTTLVTARHQRLGDLVAGTLVLRERQVGATSAPVRFEVPRGAESVAEQIDASGLRPEDHELVRAFLLRAPSLSAARRHAVAVDVVVAIAPRLRAEPPHDVPPETYLRCVAARYQQRGARPAAPPASPTPAAPVEHEGFAPPG
jgi:uncharacterized RDD family membrane protein YckC